VLGAPLDAPVAPDAMAPVDPVANVCPEPPLEGIAVIEPVTAVDPVAAMGVPLAGPTLPLLDTPALPAFPAEPTEPDEVPAPLTATTAGVVELLQLWRHGALRDNSARDIRTR
jgi:hypothetical protein